MDINFSFVNQTKQKIPKRYFLFSLENFVKKMKIKNEIEVNLILVSRAKIQELNHIYRKKDKPTDVLSFPIDITNPKQLQTKGQKLILGDIYICPQMVEKGETQNTFIHGLMHLVGYDHERNQDDWNMILNKVLAKN